jgi:hypothetical protein
MAAGDVIKLPIRSAPGSTIFQQFVELPDGSYAPASQATIMGNSPLGDEALTVSTTAVGLASIPAGASRAFITVETAAGEYFRFRVSGTAATGDAGHRVTNEDVFALDTAEQLANLSIIRDTAATADGSIFVTYF